MIAVGIDLSGPSNPANTALVCFKEEQKALSLSGSYLGTDDRQIAELVADLSKNSEVVVGMDAPLSYNIGRGDRASDSRLRKAIMKIGLPSGSVMAPTAPQMVYLTLRGLGLARCLESVAKDRIRLVEVHPTASLALRGARLDDIKELKRSTLAQCSLLNWLENQGLAGVSKTDKITDHYVAASAAALAAWKWKTDSTVWIERANPPFHPYDFAC